MEVLIVNTLPQNHPEALAAIRTLGEKAECRVMNVYEKQFRPCVGCNACWLKTPGVCSIRDGYEEIDYIGKVFSELLEDIDISK